MPMPLPAAHHLRPLVTRLGATLHFPPVGFGTAPLGGLYSACSDAEAAAAFAAARAAGFSRYIDTAPLYGLGDSERRTGAALRGLAEEGTRAGGAGARAGRALLSTKVGRLLSACAPADTACRGKFYGVPARKFCYDYSYDGVMRSFESSLERLGLDGDAIDVLLVHDLDVYTHGSAAAAAAHTRAFFETGGYRAMESLRAAGTVRAIGAGVNEADVAAALVRATDFDVVLLAGHYTLLGQAALDDFFPLCASRGVGVVLGGPFESGILATGARGGADGVAYFKYERASAEVLARTAALERACAAHGVPLAAAALAFPLLHPVVRCVLPGARTPGEVQRNAATLATAVPPALWEDLKARGLLRADAPTG